MEEKVEEVYRENPALAPREPTCSVTLFSGVGTQKLFDLDFDIGCSQEQFHIEKAALDEIRISADAGIGERDRVRLAADYLFPCCVSGAESNIYAALVQHKAGPEGIALGFVALCHDLGLECMLVEGQKDWQDHFWNIVRVDGVYYHVDLFAGLEDGFLKSDEMFWDSYRWNVNDYPKCELSSSN